MGLCKKIKTVMDLHGTLGDAEKEYVKFLNKADAVIVPVKKQEQQQMELF